MCSFYHAIRYKYMYCNKINNYIFNKSKNKCQQNFLNIFPPSPKQLKLHLSIQLFQEKGFVNIKIYFFRFSSFWWTRFAWPRPPTSARFGRGSWFSRSGPPTCPPPTSQVPLRMDETTLYKRKTWQGRDFIARWWIYYFIGRGC